MLVLLVAVQEVRELLGWTAHRGVQLLLFLLCQPLVVVVQEAREMLGWTAYRGVQLLLFLLCQPVVVVVQEEREMLLLVVLVTGVC